MHIPRISLLAATLLLAVPFAASAQTTTTAAPSPRTTASSPSAAASTAPSQRNPPFRGTITSADSAAQTFTITGKTTTRVFKVTSTTKLLKRSGGAATFADLTAGQYVTGVAKKLSAGQFEAESVKVGPKPANSDSTASPSPSASPRRTGGSRGTKASATPAASPSATR